jgi:hypothetical protein
MRFPSRTLWMPSTILEDNANLNADLRIHRVYLTAVLADIYGDMPCTEAGLGNISGISTPKYDNRRGTLQLGT